MSICEIRRLSETAERHIAALRIIVDLLWEVLGPVGLAGVGGALGGDPGGVGAVASGVTLARGP
jgi:hypothetical protein